MFFFSFYPGEIKEQYTTINFRPASEDKRYDFAVWIDELDGHIINPIKFELKFGNISVGRFSFKFSLILIYNLPCRSAGI